MKESEDIGIVIGILKDNVLMPPKEILDTYKAASVYYLHPDEPFDLERVLKGISIKILKELTGMDKDVDVEMILKVNVTISEERE